MVLKKVFVCDCSQKEETAYQALCIKVDTVTAATQKNKLVIEMNVSKKHLLEKPNVVVMMLL
jgi:hypothetical protein